VMQHATKLNDVVFAVRSSLLMSRVHISFGAYYDGLGSIDEVPS